MHIQEEDKTKEQEWDLVNWINWQFVNRASWGMTLVHADNSNLLLVALYSIVPADEQWSWPPSPEETLICRLRQIGVTGRGGGQ